MRLYVGLAGLSFIVALGGYSRECDVSDAQVREPLQPSPLAPSLAWGAGWILSRGGDPAEEGRRNLSYCPRGEWQWRTSRAGQFRDESERICTGVCFDAMKNMKDSGIFTTQLAGLLLSYDYVLRIVAVADLGVKTGDVCICELNSDKKAMEDKLRNSLNKAGNDEVDK